MKKNIKKIRKNNSGFSLLEVLLAVILLAIVVTPLIQAVYTSMSLNQKSRILMGATEVGQFVVEHEESRTYAEETSDHFWWPEQRNGYNYNAEVTIDTTNPLFDGSKYQVYGFTVDVYYLPKNNFAEKQHMITYKGSMFSKLTDD